jgi:hypothetical protein
MDRRFPPFSGLETGCENLSNLICQMHYLQRGNVTEPPSTWMISLTRIITGHHYKSNNTKVAATLIEHACYVGSLTSGPDHSSNGLWSHHQAVPTEVHNGNMQMTSSTRC